MLCSSVRVVTLLHLPSFFDRPMYSGRDNRENRGRNVAADIQPTDHRAVRRILDYAGSQQRAVA
jgi:hypothetical protein